MAKDSENKAVYEDSGRVCEAKHIAKDVTNQNQQSLKGWMK